MNPKFSGMALWREQSFPDSDGEYCWSISHDPQTNVAVVQYTDKLFKQSHSIDEMVKVLQTQLHEVRRRYEDSGDK